MNLKNFFFFGVCDGHGIFLNKSGINGHLASNHAKKYLPANLQVIELNKLMIDKSSLNFKSSANSFVNSIQNPNNYIKALFDKNSLTN